MKINIFKITIGMLLSMLVTSCAFLLTENVDWASIPDPIVVSETNTYFTAKSISFTGSPAADFGTKYKFVNEPIDDAGGGLAELGPLYLAYSARYLYLGTKMVADTSTSPSYLERGALYIMIDNNITNGDGSLGMNTLKAGNNGIGGTFGFLDDTGFSTTNGKFSVFIKHYRPYKYSEPTGENISIYQFYSGTIVKDYINGNQASFSTARYLTNGVTEIAIPWSKVLGKKPAYIPDSINLELRVDDGAGGKYFANADCLTNDPSTNTVVNWLNLSIK